MILASRHRIGIARINLLNLREWCAVAGEFPDSVENVKLVLVFFCGGGCARPCSDGFVLAGISCVFGYELPCRLWVGYWQ